MDINLLKLKNNFLEFRKVLQISRLQGFLSGPLFFVWGFLTLQVLLILL